MRHSCTPEGALPFDLHVLGTPPAFVLSQDQTLQFEPDPVSHAEAYDSGCSEATPATEVAGAAGLGNFGPMAVIRAFPCSKDRTLFSFQRPHEASPVPVPGPEGTTAVGAQQPAELP